MSQESKSIFDCASASEALRWLAEREGRGFFHRLAEKLGIHSSLFSQVAGEKKHLTEELAVSIAEEMGFSPLETEYFLFLTIKDRAATRALRNLAEAKLASIEAEARKPSRVLGNSATLTDAQKAVFYSHWYYSAIRLCTSIPPSPTAEQISTRLRLPLQLVHAALDFLVSTRLVDENAGRFAMGPQRTHEPSGTPHSVRHHLNWRLKAMEQFYPSSESVLFSFACPFSSSKADIPMLRKTLSDVIAPFNSIVDKSEPEMLSCLTLDWVQIP